MSPITRWSIEGTGELPRELSQREQVERKATEGAGAEFEKRFQKRCVDILNGYAQQLQQERYSWGAILGTATLGMGIELATLPVQFLNPFAGKSLDYILSTSAGPRLLEWLGIDSNIRTSARIGGVLPGINPLMLEAALRVKDKLLGQVTVNVPAIEVRTRPQTKPVYG